MRRIATAFALAVLSAWAPVAQERADPYQVTTVCTSVPINIGRRIAVASGGELQQALDAAVSGDTILLAPGALFTPTAPEGSFMLRNRPIADGQWVVVRSAHAAFDANGEVAPHTRLDPSRADLLPKVRATRTNLPAFKAEPGAHGYRLIGLDIGIDASVTQLTNLVELGNGSETTLDQQPNNVIVDRSWLHGNDTGNFRRGVMMNGRNLAVIDSRLENFHDTNSDSQAVGGSTGAGPFKIVNNYLEAASENILFGGNDPTIAALVPSDIEIARNLSTKRLAWQAAKVPVKNAFELKNARRVIVEGNIFEHVWVSGQDGGAILLKSVNQDGKCDWCVTEYVTFRRNIVRKAAHGLTINAVEVGRRGLANPIAANHIRIEDVLFEDIGGAEWGGGGKLFRIYGGAEDVSITHVTSRGNAWNILEANGPNDSNPRFMFAYNIVERKTYGIGAGGDEGTKTLTRNFSPYTYRQNLVVNTSKGSGQDVSNAALEARYPATTMVASDWSEVGFANGSAGLAPTSRYAGIADNGRDLGASIAAITSAQTRIARDADGCGGATAIPRKRAGGAANP